MDIDSPFLTAAAFRFEAARGVRHSDFETDIIEESGLETVPPDELANTLWQWLASEGADSPLRGSAYWALGKRRDSRRDVTDTGSKNRQNDLSGGLLPDESANDSSCLPGVNQSV